MNNLTSKQNQKEIATSKKSNTDALMAVCDSLYSLPEFLGFGALWSQ